MLNSLRIWGLLVLPLLLVSSLRAQEIGQTIRGQVVDAESQQPLAGATVTVGSPAAVAGAVTDAEGSFRVEGVPVGRQTVQITLGGYETAVLPDLMLTSGKELVLRIGLTESVAAVQDTALETELGTVEINAQSEAGQATNEMATLSARSFSVEETKRYAAAVFDPARMAQNFAGVMSSGFDMSNEIIIRGNSPRYMLWRLEGIEIPNPNHFGAMGGSGGPISMLSSSTLGQSDFYTGAFPAEFGNALSGVFDLQFRRGNNEQREYAFMVGLLGLEASTEGYFSKQSKASYLFNYRYSTLALLQGMLPSLDGILPAYQDASFHIHVPTRQLGTFSLFGLGGSNTAVHEAITDSSQWESTWDGTEYKSVQNVGIAGLRHSLLIGEKGVLRTTLAASADNFLDNATLMRPEDDYRPFPFERTSFENYALRVHTQYQHKLNARHTLRVGVLASHIAYEYLLERKEDWDVDLWTSMLNTGGNTRLLQGYGQWKWRIGTRWTATAGVHGTYLALNGTAALDPRGSLAWQAAPRHRVSLAVGMHSKPEHISTLMIERRDDGQASYLPNKDLAMSHAVHFVGGYDWQLREDLRLKVEAYYQHLYHLPISVDSGSREAIVNMGEIWDLMSVNRWASDGIGRNMGVDVTFEKFFGRGYYFMLTGSVFDSRYRDQYGDWHSTKYNNNYVCNLLGGKEWKVGKAKRNVFGVNGKAVLAGGNRYTPIDLEGSRIAGQGVEVPGVKYTAKVLDYFRFDWGIRYTINRPRTSHHFMVDIQNTINRKNIYYQYYDAEANALRYDYQNGIFPIVNYRVEF